jgi:hypothetical protein
MTDWDTFVDLADDIDGHGHSSLFRSLIPANL